MDTVDSVNEVAHQAFVRGTSEKKGIELTSSSSWYGVCVAVDNPERMGVGSREKPISNHKNDVLGIVSNLSVEIGVPALRFSQIQADQTGRQVEVRQITRWELCWIAGPVTSATSYTHSPVNCASHSGRERISRHHPTC